MSFSHKFQTVLKLKRLVRHQMGQKRDSKGGGGGGGLLRPTTAVEGMNSVIDDIL